MYYQCFTYHLRFIINTELFRMMSGKTSNQAKNLDQNTEWRMQKRDKKQKLFFCTFELFWPFQSRKIFERSLLYPEGKWKTKLTDVDWRVDPVTARNATGQKDRKKKEYQTEAPKNTFQAVGWVLGFQHNYFRFWSVNTWSVFGHVFPYMKDSIMM